MEVDNTEWQKLFQCAQNNANINIAVRQLGSSVELALGNLSPAPVKLLTGSCWVWCSDHLPVWFLVLPVKSNTAPRS